MAATKGRLTKVQQDQIRVAIKTRQLVNRLQGYALGENEFHVAEGEDPQPIEIDSGRLRAIEILIKKTLPDLSAVQLTGDNDNPVAVALIERRIVKAGD